MSDEFEQQAARLSARGVSIDRLFADLAAFEVETPSWGYGDSGTRFKVFAAPGAARDVHEKLQDAAYVHELTGACPSVALHIPWDRVDDWGALVREAGDLGIRIGAINPNLFQDDDYRLGSLCHPDRGIRQKAVDHMLECVRIARDVGSKIVSLWLADGTNYAGQDDIRTRRRRLIGCLEEVYAQLPPGMRLLIEYKFFEPGFYHTDLNDWGTAYAISLRLGPQAQVLVDTGHHAQGTNIEHLVATLLEEGRLGGFHFNSRRYADDDLIVGSANPFELFCIFQMLVGAGKDAATAACASQVAYMIDQSHNIEPKLEAMVQSVVNLQQAHARALLVDLKRLAAAQQAGDVLEAHRVLLDAYDTDPRPLLAEHRRRSGLDPDPIAALRQSGRPDLLVRQRGTRTVIAGGYPG